MSLWPFRFALFEFRQSFDVERYAEDAMLQRYSRSEWERLQAQRRRAWCPVALAAYGAAAALFWTLFLLWGARP